MPPRLAAAGRAGTARAGIHRSTHVPQSLIRLTIRDVPRHQQGAVRTGCVVGTEEKRLTHAYIHKRATFTVSA